MWLSSGCRLYVDVIVESGIQVVLILRNFALPWLENLDNFSNLRNNFQFNAIWHRQSVVTLIFCRRVAGSDVTVTPPVTRMEWLCWWYPHGSFSFLFKNIGFSYQCAWEINLRHLVQSKWKIGKRQLQWQRQLHVISWLKKGEQIVGICHNIRLAHTNVRSIVMMQIELKKVLSQELNCLFVCLARLPQSYPNELYQKLWMLVSYIFIALEINKYIV
jgi:hypothetical protein